MTFPRFVLLAVVLASAGVAPALAQQHEVGHWLGSPSVSPSQPSFRGGVRVAVGDVNGDGAGGTRLGAGAPPQPNAAFVKPGDIKGQGIGSAPAGTLPRALTGSRPPQPALTAPAIRR
jgi:hypothetical protein